MMMTSWHRSGHHVTHGLHSVFYSRAVVALCIGFLITIATATPPTNSVTDATDSTTPIGDDEFKILMEDSLTFFDDIMNTLEEEGQGQDNSGEDATVPPPSSPAEGLTPYLPRLNSGTNPVPGPKPGPKPAPKALEGTTPYLPHSVSSTDPVPEPKPAPTPASTPAAKTTEENTPYLPRLISGADPVPGTKLGPDPAPKPVPKKTEENTPYLPHMPSGENPFPGPGETPKTPKWVDSPIPFLRGKATVLPSQHETSTPTTDPKRTPTSGPWNPNQSKQRTSLSGGQSPIGGAKLSHRTLIIVLVSVGIVVMLLVFFLFSIIFYRNRKAVEQTSSLRSMPIRVGHLPDISAFEWGEASASSDRPRTQSLMSAFLFPSDPPCASNSVVLANAYLDDGIHFNVNDLMTINHASEDFHLDTKVIDLSILDDEEQPANASYVIDRPFQMYLQDADEQSDSELLGGAGNLDVTQVTFSPMVEI